MIDSSSLSIRDPFLGETNDRKGEEGANDHVYDVTEEREEVVGALRVVLYNLCERVTYLDTLPGKNYDEEYQRPEQHDED